METVEQFNQLNQAKKQTDKIVNYNGANNSYIYALNLMKTLGLQGFMDKIPFPCENNIVNIQIPQEQPQQSSQLQPQAQVSQSNGGNAKNAAKTALKAAAIGAAIFGTGGIGALALPAALSLLEKAPQIQQNITEPNKVLPEAEKIDPNFSFQVK